MPSVAISRRADWEDSSGLGLFSTLSWYFSKLLIFGFSRENGRFWVLILAVQAGILANTGLGTEPHLETLTLL